MTRKSSNHTVITSYSRRTVLKTGASVVTGIAALSTAGVAQDEEDSGGHDVTITVVDQDENPVQGKITLLGPDAGIVGERELDENGQAIWDVFEDGEYTYNIYEVTGYEPVSDDSSFEVTEDTELTVEMQAIDEKDDDDEPDDGSERDERNEDSKRDETSGSGPKPDDCPRTE